MLDYDAGDRDSGDIDTGNYDQTEVKLKTVNGYHPSHGDFSKPKSVSRGDTELARRHLQESREILARSGVTVADAEAVRAAFWMRASAGVRTVMLMAAGLDKSRNIDALKTFNAFERGKIWIAIEKFSGELDTIKKCMHGGPMPTPSGTRH
jgi:hypothetical protein